MADNNTVILRVQLDEAGTEKKLQEITLQIEQTTKAQAALKKQRELNIITDAEFTKQSVDLSLQLRGQRQEFAANQRNLENFRAANAAAADSVNELAARSKLLTPQYNALSAAERTNTEAGRLLSAELKRVNDALIAAGKGVSDGRRNVGLYSEDFKKAAGDLNLFGVNVGQVAGNLSGKLNQGLTIAKSGFGSLKAAVASTGIGLLLLAFTTLFEYFQKTDEGAELLEASLSAIGAVVNVVSGLAIRFGKALVEAATNPKQAFSDLVSFLETNVANRFKAFGVLIDAVKNGNLRGLADGAIQLSTGIADGTAKMESFGKQTAAVVVEMKRAAAAAFQLKQETFKLEDKQRASVVSLERQRNLIDKLVISAKDRSLSEQQRLANLDKASELETKGLATTTELAKEKLRILLATNAEAVRTGKISDEQRDAATQAEAEVVKLAGQSATLQQQIQNRRAGLLEQAAAERKAAAAATLERQRDEVRARQTSLELQLLEVQKGSAAELAVRTAQINAARDLELIAERQTADQKKLIRAKAQVEIRELEDTFFQKQLEDAKKHDAATTAEAKREYDEAVKNLDSYLNEKRASVERAYAQGQISENVYQQQLNALEKAGYNAALVNAEDYGQDKARIIKAQADLEIKEANRVKDEKKKIEDVKQQIQDASFQAAANVTDGIIKLYGEESAAGQVALTIKKTLALAEIGISLEKQLAANAEAGTKISASAPPVTIPLGIAYTIATDALAITGAAASAAKILGFQQGGVLNGPPHQQGGIPFTVKGRPGFEAEGGEVILTKGVWDNPLFRPLVSALNVAGGGAPLLPRAHMAVGGVAQPLVLDQLRGNTSTPFDYDKLARAMSQVKVRATIQDVKAGLDRDAETQRVSNG